MLEDVHMCIRYQDAKDFFCTIELNLITMRTKSKLKPLQRGVDFARGHVVRLH